MLVQPYGYVTSIAMTYSSKVPHSQARARLVRFATAAGVEVASVSVRDEWANAFGTAGGSRASGRRQTGLEATLRGAGLVLDRAFRLDPFVEALGDVGSFEVLFMMDRREGFAGIRSYDGPGVSLRLIQDGAPYRYAFRTSGGTARRAAIPVYEPEARSSPVAASRQEQRGRRANVPVLMWGTACGVAVYLGMLIRSRMRSAAAPPPRGM
ncbi:MAG: hypothetical protein FJX72_09935 [Armatimonadetes bacterium]|nr:hypothetical protein [Armatimonadota bacterium]